MHNLRLLGWSAGLAGLVMTTSASAIPMHDSHARFTALEDTSSRLTWFGSSEWNETFAWNGVSWIDMTRWDRPGRAGLHSWHFMVPNRGWRPGNGPASPAVVDDDDLVPTTPAAEITTTAISVPDGGGTTAVLLLGALLSIATVSRRIRRAHSATK